MGTEGLNAFYYVNRKVTEKGIRRRHTCRKHKRLFCCECRYHAEKVKDEKI